MTAPIPTPSRLPDESHEPVPAPAAERDRGDAGREGDAPIDARAAAQDGDPGHSADGHAAAAAPARKRRSGARSGGDRGDAIASLIARWAPARQWAPSPAIGRAEVFGALLAGLLLALLTTWPLVLHLPSRIAPDLGDPVRTAWQVGWVGHAMLHNPLHIFNANDFYPHPLSLAFSDSLLGYGPAGFFGSGTVAALVRYNLLFLFAWTLCFFGAYLLARELGLRRLGAAAAAGAFAYAPYRVTEAGHLHVISSGGIPLALFLFLRGYRRALDGRGESRDRGAAALIAGGWLVTAWQISLGFSLGLQFAYLLALLTAITLGVWWQSGRPMPSRRVLVATCAGVALVGAVTAYQARPYLKVAHDYPTAKRTIKEVKNYSAGPAAWLSAPKENRVWGDVTAEEREHVHSKNESVFFPGGLIFVLALAGLAASLLTPRLRLGLLATIIVCSVLALGFGLTGAGYPYRIFYDHAPGFDGVRVPGRIFTTATLAYALLAGAGAQLLARRAREWGERRSLRGVELAVASALVIGVIGEGAGHLADPVVPQPTRAEIGLPGPRLDLPTDGPADRVWQYFSTDGFYEIPIGNSTFDIPAVDDLRGGLEGFPDRASVEKLRYYNIRTVVLHLKLPKLPGIVGYAHPEPPDVIAASAKPIAGLGVTSKRIGSIVIYSIGPGPAALHS
jgi:hypothetical protein